MAHDCPECYTLCHCNGDIDDINFGEDLDCTHYRKLECCGHREYCGDSKCACREWEDYYEDEDFYDAQPPAGQ